MSITQLDAFNVVTPFGAALAMFVEVDTFDVYWCTFQTETGECWWWRNELIRLANSYTAGRPRHTNPALQLSPEERATLAPHLKRHTKAEPWPS